MEPQVCFLSNNHLQPLEMDEYGLLCQPSTWDKQLAEDMASVYGLDELTEDHWLLIYSLRDYYDEYETVPPVSMMCTENGMNKACGSTLFRTCLIAWRVAGLPDPGEEARAYLSAEM